MFPYSPGLGPSYLAKHAAPVSGESTIAAILAIGWKKQGFSQRTVKGGGSKGGGSKEGNRGKLINLTNFDIFWIF